MAALPLSFTQCSLLGETVLNGFWGQVVDAVNELRRLPGSHVVAAGLVTAARTATVFRKQRELMRLDVLRRYAGISWGNDAFFHVRHRHYLSSHLTTQQRIDCALVHYRYEDNAYVAAYKEAVYRGDGIVLWNKAVGPVVYSLVLRGISDVRHEGGVSVVLLADGNLVSEMSFAWVGGSIVGTSDDIVPFITKNQSARHDWDRVRRFREDFPQNSPAYFCLAAMNGVAEAHRKSRLAGIRHHCQIAFETQYADSFRRSYCDFWKSFGGVESGPQAYVMAVPLAAAPLSQVKSRHRKRALERRRHWSEIADAAAAVVSRYRRSHNGSEAPIGRLLAALLPHATTLMSLATSV